jgi:hypothetical protein
MGAHALPPTRPLIPPPLPLPPQEVHRAARREADNVAARNDRGRGPPPGRGGPPFPGETQRRPSGVDHLRRDELPTAPMKAGLGARTASSELSLRPQGFGGSKGASPARGAGERVRVAAPAPGPSRVAQQQQQQQEQQQQPAAAAAERERPAAAAPRRAEGSEDSASAGGSARPSDAGGGGGGGGSGGGGLTETEVHGHIESIMKLLFGQTDDTGETPEALLAQVVESADDLGGALQELLRQCLDVRGVELDERLEKPKVRQRGGSRAVRGCGVLGRRSGEINSCASGQPAGATV